MKHYLVFIFLFILAISLTGCFQIDEEINEIAKSGSYQDCDSLDTSDNKNRIEQCYSKVGQKQNDVNACNAIDGTQRTLRDNCYGDIAVDTKNTDLCDKLNFNKYACYADVGLASGNPHICMNLGVDDAPSCYKRYATSIGDVEVCKSIISGNSERDSCLYFFLGEAKDETFCAQFEKQSYKEDCYVMIAPKVKGNLLCDKITNQQKKENCIISVAKESKDINHCNGIDVYSKRWFDCAFQVAIVTQDKSICKSFPDSTIEQGDLAEKKKSCEMQVQNAIESTPK